MVWEDLVLFCAYTQSVTELFTSLLDSNLVVIQYLDKEKLNLMVKLNYLCSEEAMC